MSHKQNTLGKDIFDIKVYVETDLAVRRERFLRRAYTERNQDLNNAKKHWDYILGAGEKYVQPAREFAVGVTVPVGIAPLDF